MPLIKCQECDKEVSDSAKKCIHCGAKIKKPISKTKKISYWVLFFLVCILIAQCEDDKKERERERENAPPKTLEQQQKDSASGFATIIRMSVAANAKEKDTISFRNEYFYYHPVLKSVYCAEVNGKNSFGGYTGYKRLVAVEVVKLLEIDDGKSSFNDGYNKFCVDEYNRYKDGIPPETKKK